MPGNMSPLIKGASDVKLPEDLTEMMSTLYEKSTGSDVTFVMDDGQRLKAHRIIMASNSPVFEKMLLGIDFKESIDGIVKLPGKSSFALEKVLKFLHTRSIELSKLGLDVVIDMLLMAHEYHISKLFDVLSTALKIGIEGETVLTIFEAAFFLQDELLLDACRGYLFENAEKVLKNPQFYELSKAALIDIISQDLFNAPEIDILFAVNEWQERNKSVDIKDVLAKVRFPYMNVPAGMSFLRLASLVQLLLANSIDLKLVGQENPHLPSDFVGPRKAFDEPTANIATLAGKTLVFGADAESVLTNQMDNLNHVAMGNAITVKMARPYVVGSLSFYGFADGSDSYAFEYKIETSIDGEEWEVLSNFEKRCRQKQLFMFNPRKLQFGFSAIQYPHKDFAITSFECPASLTADDKSRYRENCPNGGTLLYGTICGKIDTLIVNV